MRIETLKKTMPVVTAIILAVLIVFALIRSQPMEKTSMQKEQNSHEGHSH